MIITKTANPRVGGLYIFSPQCYTDTSNSPNQRRYPVVSPRLQEIIDRIVGERIAILAAIIRTQEEPCVSLAAE
ncbi:MAG: hypothetical protein UY31_C0009G0019 [Candidatus Wolfebacteria bacterium GW2011_GWE1_48_7]|uniref:Uncharacterized protein n=2 Tax=Candidatus Wolfeibacteriota TaxID=1752735 RepID=A0A0G1U8K7_9BACT|nr:MAG: hypothetical protein UX70_C0001G0463 [Candidatus Wolfebacteria bacterium GW2011_GWB1_47_1]KKU37177.1 MAG: hypothetical protein UX49_C0001G0047 [Candidatus Wolfebacteria bacterium GW2011_GWC2_46_275]KKU42663.1 MAG: hypothetical protein UX58_C0001G0095 [Candidatus Wolfebacteria bacterium GW2011_GWB2_46_69]KKU54602.1 MAG: hypothetical protein UX76_C0001G0061 [Candidatus Wolfebacteria bacterium GW2011_GWC1_47_103]KKU59986.1 MAG: hypothetical protein UX83_C0001G0061 [Candidatus Wolfebacteria